MPPICFGMSVLIIKFRALIAHCTPAPLATRGYRFTCLSESSAGVDADVDAHRAVTHLRAVARRGRARSRVAIAIKSDSDTSGGPTIRPSFGCRRRDRLEITFSKLFACRNMKNSPFFRDSLFTFGCARVPALSQSLAPSAFAARLTERSPRRHRLYGTFHFNTCSFLPLDVRISDAPHNPTRITTCDTPSLFGNRGAAVVPGVGVGRAFPRCQYLQHAYVWVCDV